MDLIKYLPHGMKYLQNEPMSRHTTFRTGGLADLILLPSSADELLQCLKLLAVRGEKPVVIGNGSNLLVSDKGIRGTVVKICEQFSWVKTSGNLIECGAGTHLAKLCSVAAENSLSGCESLFGIPGTVGGAVYMNAGAYGSETKDTLRKVTYTDLTGAVSKLEGVDGYGYRRSPFTGSDNIIISAVFELSAGERKDIEEKMKDVKSRRAEKQPINLPSAGSTFKRPEGYFAAALIEQAGLKGFTIGGAQVSEKHSGFIVNVDRATTADILRLMEVVKEKVFKDFGVVLEPEVKFVGEK